MLVFLAHVQAPPARRHRFWRAGEIWRAEPGELVRALEPDFQNYMGQREPVVNFCYQDILYEDPTLVWVGRFCDRTEGTPRNEFFDLCSKPNRPRDYVARPWRLGGTPYDTLAQTVADRGRAIDQGLLREPGGMTTEHTPTADSAPVPGAWVARGYCPRSHSCVQVLRRDNHDPHILCVRQVTPHLQTTLLSIADLDNYFLLANGYWSNIQLSTQDAIASFRFVDTDPPPAGQTRWRPGRGRGRSSSVALKLPLEVATARSRTPTLRPC